MGTLTPNALIQGFDADSETKVNIRSTAVGALHTSSIDHFELNVARGLVSGHSVFHKFGLNADTGDSAEILAPQGGTLLYPSPAAQLKVSSSSPNDTSDGSGMKTCVIYGLDANYNLLSETITMTGQTAVTTVGTYLRVYRLIGATAGATGYNEGVVYIGAGTVTNGVPATVYMQVPISVGQSLHTAYTVPLGYTLYIDGVYADVNAVRATQVDLRMRPQGGMWNVKLSAVSYQNPVEYAFEYPLKVAQKTDIEMTGLVTTLPAASISGGFHGVLINAVD